MHGLIFAELRKYVDTKVGPTAWSQLLESAGLKGKMYLPSQEYPDEDVVKLVTTASTVTGLPVPIILEDFGSFIAPSLLGMYRSLVKPTWKTLDVLEFTENTIHTVVRARNAGAKPAELAGKRVSPTELHLTYTSARKLCPIAKGIIKGLGTHFKEEVVITESQCMHRGGANCQMVVKTAA